MERNAYLDAEDFVLPPEVLTRDADDLRRLGSIEALVRERQDLAEPARYNIHRCNAVLSECDPLDLERCRDLAINGSRIPLPQGFERQRVPNPLRNLASKLGNTYIKSAYKLWLDGRIMIVPYKDIMEYDYESLNFSCDIHWVGAPGKVAGRMLIDPSNASEGNYPLNSPEVKEIGEKEWGELHHPTINAIVTNLLEHAFASGHPISEYRLCKEDVSNAFACNKIAPKDAALFATPLTDSLIMLHYYNNFGHNIGPHIFGPLSRSFTVAIRKKVSGTLDTYVDDLMAFFHHLNALADQAIMKSTMLDLLGPKGLSAKSYGPSPTGEIIGWHLDLTAGTIRPSDRGIRKLALVFLTIDITSKDVRWPLQLCQVAASLTERYSRAIIAMRAFVEPFIGLTRNAAKDPTSGSKSLRKITSLVKMAVVVWRAVIIIMLSDPDRLAVPLESMVIRRGPTCFTHSAVTDAADSVGLGLFDGQGILMACTTYLLPFSAHDARYQNTREFLGIILAMILFRTHFRLPKGTKIAVKSDSMSAITWIEKNRAASQYAHVAFLTYTWTRIVTGYEIVELTHIAGKSEEMFDYDALSRNRSTKTLNMSAFTSTTTLPWLNELFKLCDPTKDRSCVGEHMMVFQTVVKCLAGMLQ